MPDFPVNALPPQVWAYYHPFYGTPSRPSGRWLTWNEPLRLGTGYGAAEVPVSGAVSDALRHDPDRFLSPGRRDNYSAFYPVLGLYDCLDPKDLTQHARWAVRAGLDGLIWDYMLVGEDNADKNKPLAETVYDRSLRVFLKVIEDESLPLSASILYDTFCWYGFSTERIAAELRHLVSAYAGHPHMLHFGGRLVVFIYSVFAKHTPAEWLKICALLSECKARDRLFLVAGEVWVYRPDFYQPRLFDGFGAYNQGVNFLTPDGMRDLALTLRTMADRNRAKFWSAPVQPGFDGRSWHHPGRVVARGLGALYESLWEAVIGARPPMITVCSFNEWGEGTQIEPAEEYGDLYLELTAKWAATYKQRLATAHNIGTHICKQERSA